MGGCRGQLEKSVFVLTVWVALGAEALPPVSRARGRRTHINGHRDSWAGLGQPADALTHRLPAG